MMQETIDKLRQHFSEMTVYKDLQNSNFFSVLSLPSFTRDWLLQKFSDETGQPDYEEVKNFVKKFMPKNTEWTEIKSRIIKDYESVKLLAKISVDIDTATGKVSFSLPEFGLSKKETIIEDSEWEQFKDQLVKGRETWGMIELDYRPPDDNAKPKIPGKIRLTKFKNFCPYIIDNDYYKEVRKYFSVQEWIDIILGAVDYNADGYDSEQKLTMLTRLLPFVEKRLNLIELAPKGTGKSYLFGRVSRYGWLSSGGTMSRAKMFYDNSRRIEGLVAGHDFITLDEIQTISFADEDELRGALKGYLESGIFTVGNYEGKADAGIVLCGNVCQEKMEADGTVNLFSELPLAFHESALIDRFHGLIKGWNIPRMNENLKMSGWALNSEYFCSILHDLRDDPSYRAIVDQLIEVPQGADTRDTEAVKRICAAYLKLLFPHVSKPEDIKAREFKQYCLKRAVEMRGIIKYQLGLLDSEFRGKDIPDFRVKGRYL